MVLTQWSITSVRSGQLTGLAFGHAGARRRYAVAIRCEPFVTRLSRYRARMSRLFETTTGSARPSRRPLEPPATGPAALGTWYGYIR